MTTRLNKLDNLLRLLRRRHPGVLHGDAASEVLEGLRGIWLEVRGSGVTRMEPRKLTPDRVEDLTWDPPRLVFRIERHGAAAHGSANAEVQEWSINLEEMRASTCSVARRRLSSVKPIRKAEVLRLATSMASIIVARSDVAFVAHVDTLATVLLKKVSDDFWFLQESSAPKETVAGRRKRFREALDDAMKERGWFCIGRWRYRSPGER